MEGGYYYASQVKSAAQRKDYELLADLLWIPVLKNPPRHTSISISTMLKQPVAAAIELTGIPLGEMLEEHFKVLSSLAQGDTIKGWQHTIAALQILLKTLPNESRAEVPILKRLCSNLFYLTILPLSNKEEGEDGGRREEAARVLSRAFTTAITDRTPLPCSKKWAAISIANILFRLYFHLGTVRLCHNIVRAIDTTAQAEFPLLKEFPKSEVITFCYFRARLAINQSDFKRAEEFLLDALKICPPQYIPQKRELMIYLILVKIIHGHLPLPELLTRHELTSQYAYLSQAVRTGDLRLFDRVLLANQSFYMKKEIFLVIQLQLRNLILRSFFKKLYLIGLTNNAHLEYRLNLRLVEAAFIALGISDMNLDEVECITANLIFNGFIKGYISHEKSLVVLNPLKPFGLDQM